MRKLCWLGMIIGSAIGGYIPSLWGAGIISFSGLIGSLAGGIFGIWVGYRIAQ